MNENECNYLCDRPASFNSLNLFLTLILKKKNQTKLIIFGNCGRCCKLTLSRLSQPPREEMCLSYSETIPFIWTTYSNVPTDSTFKCHTLQERPSESPPRRQFIDGRMRGNFQFTANYQAKNTCVIAFKQDNYRSCSLTKLIVWLDTTRCFGFCPIFNTNLAQAVSFREEACGGTYIDWGDEELNQLRTIENPDTVISKFNISKFAEHSYL